MRIISQEGLLEPVNVPYDRVAVRLHLETFKDDGATRRRIVAIEGINTYLLGVYSSIDEAETVFEAIISAGFTGNKNAFKLPKDHYTEEPVVLAPSR